MTTNAPTLADLQSDAVNLRHVLDEAMSHLMELDYGTGETRNHELDRIAALTSVSRDLAERLIDRLAAAEIAAHRAGAARL